MTEGAYEIVRYTPDLAPAVLELQRHLWGPEPEIRERYLDWKHHRNPWLASPRIVLAMHAGRAVGMRSAFGAMWEAGAPPVRRRMVHADDFVIHPEHRGSGLATRLLQAAHEDLVALGDDFAVSLRGSAVTLIGSLATGWKAAGSTRPVEFGERQTARRPFVREVVRRTPFLWRWADLAGGRPRRAAFERFDAASRRGAPRGLPVRVSSTPAEEMAELVARLPWDGRIRHVRDVAALAWLLEDPLKETRVLVWRAREVRGYLMLRRFRSRSADPSIVYLTDWEGEDDEVRTGLLETAITWGGFPRIGTWVGALPRSAAALLARIGFTERRDRPTDDFPRHILVRALGDRGDPGSWAVGGRRLLDADSWDVRMY